MLVIANCPIKVQLNGTSVYIIFDGSEEQAQGAFMTLWNVNAHSAETMCDAGAFFYVSTTLAKLQRGLFNLAQLRILNGKGDYVRMRGKLWQEAIDMAKSMFDSAEKCHVISANAALCDALSMGSPHGSWDGHQE
jgi:hypothetical protein